MARVVVGYEGEGSARRPIYRDDGPARARGTHNPSGLERLTGSPVLAFADPDRERAQVVAARREAWGESRGMRGVIDAAAGEAKARRAAVEDADLEDPLDDRRDVMERQVALLRAQEQEEAATMIQAEQLPGGVLGSGLGDLDVEVGLPCEGCLHVPVCRIREELLATELRLIGHVLPAGITRDIVVELRCEHRLEAPAIPREMAVRTAMELGEAAGRIQALSLEEHPGVKEALEQAEAAIVDSRLVNELVATEGLVTMVDAEARLARVVAPRTDPEAIAARREQVLHGDNAEHASTPRHRRERRAGEIRMQHEEEQRRRAGKHGLTPKQERALELLREHDGSFTRVAERLGVSAGAISSLAKGIREKGRMPADVDALLAARSHKPAEASA